MCDEKIQFKFQFHFDKWIDDRTLRFDACLGRGGAVQIYGAVIAGEVNRKNRNEVVEGATLLVNDLLSSIQRGDGVGTCTHSISDGSLSVTIGHDVATIETVIGDVMLLTFFSIR